jgi:hypothetical protein
MIAIADAIDTISAQNFLISVRYSELGLPNL